MNVVGTHAEASARKAAMEIAWDHIGERMKKKEFARRSAI